MSSAPVEVDLVVIGTGPGGESLANQAAASGLSVVAVDKHLVGGECPYYGCIPSKMMLRAADALAEGHRAGQLAGEVTIVPSWAPVARRVSEEATDHWNDRVAVERLQKAGATVHHGVGRLDGARRVVVQPAHDGDEIVYAARLGVVLNPGTRPAEPGIEGLSGTPYWTNREALQATSLPGSLAIIGGGPIGCELAQVFARFGVRVTILQHGDRLLPADEPDASAALEKVLVGEGVRVLTRAETTKVEHGPDFTLTLADGQRVTADQLLVAAGRVRNLDDIGLETVGLDVGNLRVDDRMRAVDGLWVIGDVTGHGAFTHISMYQSAIALRSILAAAGKGEEGAAALYRAVPHTTFTDPEVAGVGLTEAAARDAGLTVRVGQADLGASSRGFTHGPGATGFVKVVEDADRGVLLGASVVGPAAGEICAMLTLAVHAEIPVETLRTMIYAYPTFHRTIETALADLS